MPACGAEGVRGLPVPRPLDVTAIIRPTTPNTALAAPADFLPTPDVVTGPYRVPPERLYQAILALAQAQPRVFPAAQYHDLRQVHFVARSAWLNFPDLITAAVSGPDDGPSTLVLYSRSVYGHSDLGVNRARIDAWLPAIQAALESPMASER